MTKPKSTLAPTSAPDADPTPRERVQLAIGPNKTGHEDMAREAHVTDEAAPTPTEAP